MNGIGRRGMTVATLVAFLGGLGCNGIIGDALEDGVGERPPGTLPPPVDLPTADECAELAAAVGPSPLRRLSTAQLANTIADLLGIETVPESVAARLVEIPDGREGGFDTSVGAPTPEVLLLYLSVAEETAAAIVADHLADFGSCGADDAACATELLDRLGRLALRRPLERGTPGSELERLVAIYETYLPTDGALVAIETAITAIFLSPSFIYLAEPVVAERASDGLVPLDPFALASRLSYLLWQSGPDEELLDAAESGLLDDPASLAAQVERMLDHPRAVRSRESFYSQWLQLDELENADPGDAAFTPALQSAMYDETLAFVEDVTLGTGTFDELLTASHTVGSAAVADLYGAAAPASGVGRIELDPEQRAGILTQASLLTGFGTVYPEIHRGLWVRTNLLCDPPPPPPPDVPPADAAHRLTTSPCNGCHVRMDPIGFGFADYDSLGRFVPRSDEQRAAEPPEIISPDGALGEDLTGGFSGPRELAERLAGSRTVGDCFSTQWLRFAIGRRETEADGCNVVAVHERFAGSGGNLVDLVVAIATEPSFRSRSIDELTETAH